MPIVFQELEDLLEKWIKRVSIKIPKNSPATWLSFKIYVKKTNEYFIQKIIELISSIKKEDIPSKRFYIISKM
jgi:hypothetical protein